MLPGLLHRLPVFMLTLLFAVAQIACLCAHATPVTQAASKHSCCSDESATAKRDGPSRDAHNDPCPHCDNIKAAVIAAEPAATLDTAVGPIATPVILPPSFVIAMCEPRDIDAARSRERAPPPPDLLRVKCSMQI